MDEAEILAFADRLKAKKEPSADPLTDDALALAFADRNPLLRYVEERGKWMRWTEYRWVPDATGHTFANIRDMLRSMPAPNRGAVESAKTVAAVEKLARYDRCIAATLEQWDADDWLLNTPSGIFNLRTGDIGPSDPIAYMTKATAAAPGGDCPRWRQFLREVTDDDIALADFLQRMAGYTLSGSIREHALFFLWGTGGNGKGVYLNTLHAVLGDYSVVSSMETFTASHSERHPTDLAALNGARLVIAQETEDGRRWAESRIKALTGGDPISARFMRQDFFTFLPRFKLVIAGNHKPRLVNVDEAMRRRLHLVPFTVSIPAHRRDNALTERLRAEWPGILQWAIDGCREYLAQGLNPPAAVREATANYFGAEDLFGQWLADCCEEGAKYWEIPTRLFKSWTTYCAEANERPGRMQQFAERMRTRGFQEQRDMGQRRWTGLRLDPTQVSFGE